VRTSILPRRGPRPRPGAVRLLAVLALAAATSATAAACSSSSSSAAASSTSSAAALSQDCTAVTDVLADGPDPTADSVGYAQAQLLPLKQLKLTEARVQSAVSRLETAFTAFVAAKDSSTQTQAAVQVTSAENAVNAVCPGAAG
jgi:hypothetical protein